MMELKDLAKKYVPDVNSVEFLTKCRNIIYKANCRKYSFVLRLINSKNKDKEQIESELIFQNYLFQNGADVVRPLPSCFGEYCICFHDEKKDLVYWVSAFEYATGKNWDERNDNDEKTFQIIGKTLGRIHRLSKEYDSKKSRRRRLWSKQHELVNAPALFKEYNPNLYDAFFKHMEVMDRLEKSVQTFGLTHGDYLMSNYLIDGSKIKVIDFDECEYSWYAMDLAICMRCYLIGSTPESVSDRTSEAEMMHYNILRGYSTENCINEQMVYGLDAFIKVRDFIEMSRILELMLNHKTLGDMEYKLFRADMDRTVNGKHFMEFKTQKVEKLL